MLKHRIFSILALAVLLVCTGCEWVKSDLDDCPQGYWLKLEYSYNLQNIDAASQLEDVTVLAYDSTGRYVKSLYSTKAERLQNDGRIELKDFTQGLYTFVVWAGVSANNDMAIYHTFSQECIDSLRAGLKYPETVQTKDFGDIYYGYATKVKLNGGHEATTVKMIKDTNKLVCLVHNTDSKSMSEDELTMEVTADNGLMDALNKPISGKTVTYQPYSSETVKIYDPEAGDSIEAVRFGFKLLRLLADDNSRLKLKSKKQNGEIINIPLSQYIGKISALYEMYGVPLSEQEYLDRQDFHTFVFYLSKESSTESFQLIKLRVNNWIVRLDEDAQLKE